MTIRAFRGKFRFLSNFYPSPIVWDGFEWPTVEHAYQAAKTEDAEWRRTIREADTPGLAKRLGRSIPKDLMDSMWDDPETPIKRVTMEHLLELKFEQNPDLAEKLLATGDEELVEGNTWGDTTWGRVFEDGEWRGENWLGKALMQTRERLKGWRR